MPLVRGDDTRTIKSVSTWKVFVFVFLSLGLHFGRVFLQESQLNCEVEQSEVGCRVHPQTDERPAQTLSHGTCTGQFVAAYEMPLKVWLVTSVATLTSLYLMNQGNWCGYFVPTSKQCLWFSLFSVLIICTIDGGVFLDCRGYCQCVIFVFVL